MCWVCTGSLEWVMEMMTSYLRTLLACAWRPERVTPEALQGWEVLLPKPCEFCVLIFMWHASSDKSQKLFFIFYGNEKTKKGREFGIMLYWKYYMIIKYLYIYTLQCIFYDFNLHFEGENIIYIFRVRCIPLMYELFNFYVLECWF